jgi:hypothetical protein
MGEVCCFVSKNYKLLQELITSKIYFKVIKAKFLMDEFYSFFIARKFSLKLPP